MEKVGEEETREMQKKVNMYLEEAECVKEAMNGAANKESSSGCSKSQNSQFTEQVSDSDSNSDDDHDNPIYNFFSGIGSAVIAVGRGVREWMSDTANLFE